MSMQQAATTTPAPNPLDVFFTDLINFFESLIPDVLHRLAQLEQGI
jgi:hypothetical protein